MQSLIRSVCLTLSTLLAVAVPSAQEVERAPVLEGDALKQALGDQVADLWIYDDLEAAYAAAEKSKKPLLVSFRCVP